MQKYMIRLFNREHKMIETGIMTAKLNEVLPCTKNYIDETSRKSGEEITEAHISGIWPDNKKLFAIVYVSEKSK